MIMMSRAPTAMMTALIGGILTIVGVIRKFVIAAVTTMAAGFRGTGIGGVEIELNGFVVRGRLGTCAVVGSGGWVVAWVVYT